MGKEGARHVTAKSLLLKYGLFPGAHSIFPRVLEGGEKEGERRGKAYRKRTINTDQLKSRKI